MRTLLVTGAVALAASADVSLPVDRDGRPNILLLFPDQWRFDWAGFAYPQTSQTSTRIPLTANTTAWVASSGVRFTQAYVPAPVCAPSRSCLASGREYDRAGVASNAANDYPEKQTTFYSLLRDSGYHTMTTGKDDLTKATQMGSKNGYPGCPKCLAGDGLYHQDALGFSDGLRYEGKVDVIDLPQPHEMYGYFLRNHTVHLENGTEVNAWDAHKACFGRENKHLCDSTSFPQYLYEDDFTTRNAITLLQRRPTNKPFFLQVSFPGPHSPFLVTSGMQSSMAGRMMPEATDGSIEPTQQAEDTDGLGSSKRAGGKCVNIHEPTDDGVPRCNYAAEVEHLDSLFARIISEVEAQGVLPNTIVCISSDHGEMLGDHNRYGKTLPWQGSASVPLLCAGPGIAKGKVHTLPVATLDMAGTFLDYAGVPPDPGMTVRSFRGLLEGDSTSGYRDVVLSGLAHWRMAVSRNDEDGKSYKFICCLNTCAGNPSTLPTVKKGQYERVVICVDDDPYDMHDLSDTEAGAAMIKKLAPFLPGTWASVCAAMPGEQEELVV